MTQNYDILFSLSALAIIAGAFLYMHLRLSRLETQLAVAQQKVKDDETVARVHTLSDADLDSKMSDFLGSGNK